MATFWERAAHSVYQCFSYFPLWFCERDFDSDCVSSWSLLIFSLLKLFHQLFQAEDLFVQTMENVDVEGPSSDKSLEKSKCAPLFMAIYQHTGT